MLNTVAVESTQISTGHIDIDLYLFVTKTHIKTNVKNIRRKII